MGAMRQRLFLSYSRRDPNWHELFTSSLAEQFRIGDEVWVDVDCIRGGDKWEESIRQAAATSKCALLLLTKRYLDQKGFARKELDLLLKEARNGLELLPVLVEPCSWETIEDLNSINLMKWHKSLKVVPLRDAGNETDKEFAVIEICKQIKARMGAAGATTLKERDTLREATEKALEGKVQICEPVRTGQFSVVFRARFGEETVAVKAVPAEVRQERVRLLFNTALKAAQELSDPALIDLRFYHTDTEPNCFVMDYMDDKEWPTLKHKLAQDSSKRPSPLRVAGMLSTIARAQGVAHRSNLQLGPLCSANIYVNKDWEIKISPFRIEGQLALAAGLEDGQLLRWEMLADIIPEVYRGEAIQPQNYDRLEQYYLGLFGLELLLGYKPVDVRCFEHLERKREFFNNPRSFFVDPGAVTPWTEESPALAFIMIRLLAQEPDGRYPTANEASGELAAVAKGLLPDSVREEVDSDYETVAKVDFVDNFYQRLFRKRTELPKLFPNIKKQHGNLVEALVDLKDFNPMSKHSRFLDLANRHKERPISSDDVEAFRRAFLEQIEELFPANPAKRDAWNAVLKRGLEIIVQKL